MPTSGRSSFSVAKPAIFSELSTISWMEAKLIITDNMTMAIGSNFVRPEKQINNLQQEKMHCHLKCRINGVTKFIEEKCQKTMSTKLKSKLLDHYYIHVHGFTPIGNDYLHICTVYGD